MSSMTPSVQEMTDGQIDKVVDIFRARLRKGRATLSSEAVQHVLGQSELPDEMFGVFQKRVEAVSSMIVRRVKVDRSRSPEQVIDATGRNKYTDGKVVKHMPRGTGEETDIRFFKVGRFISDDELEKEYELRGLRPADPESLAKVNEDDQAFADTHPNGTHWKDVDGKWCFAFFCRWSGKRFVDVRRYDNDWRDFRWFAGVCK